MLSRSVGELLVIHTVILLILHPFVCPQDVSNFMHDLDAFTEFVIGVARL